MPLSEYEQRVLDQLERDLGADPKLGRTMSKGPRQRGRIAIGFIGTLLGLGVVLAGVMTNVVPLGIAGFALMIASTMWAIFAPAAGPAAKPRRASAGGAQSLKARQSKQPFMRRVEQRLERRRESGDL